MDRVKKYKFIEKLKSLSFVDEVWLYGSRARGDNEERSDIDLAIVCPRATEDNWFKILDVIENADTLLEIDCVRFDDLKESKFKKRIKEERVRL
jgi:predicted nucleotidyltransferase